MKQVKAITMTAALLALLAVPAISAIRAISHPSGEMIIGYQVVLRIRSAADGMSIQQRVDQITTRLNKRLGSRDFDPKFITVRQYGDEYAVMHKDSMIVTADSKTAAYNKTSSKKLANQWSANLKRVIPMAKALTEGP
ncbi:MAG: hypothetical protein ACYC27_22380 [Armatimonadota bacterium]